MGNDATLTSMLEFCGSRLLGAIERSDDGVDHMAITVKCSCGRSILIKSKSTASGGETPKGSAVPGVYRPHRDRWHTEGTLLSRSSWSRGDLVKRDGAG